MLKIRFHRKRRNPGVPFPILGIVVSLSLITLIGEGPRAFGAPSNKDLENSFGAGQWDETVEIAHEILLRDPTNSLAKLRAAYSLFQRGFSNAALKYLKMITPQEWKTLPEGQNRFIEIVSLFQKKVPLNVLPGRLDQLDENQVAPTLKDEILFSKGRRFFEVKDFARARPYLEKISKGSRFFAQARYILGSMLADEKNYKEAATEFSKIFEPSVFEQSSEFWKDISTQTNQHWGASVRILMDSDVLQKSNTVASLSLVALARVAYGAKDFETALARYDKISPASRSYPQASLEKIWTLLALNRHEQAQQTATELMVDERTFQSLQARPLRALILVDAGKTKEARAEVAAFQKVYDDTRADLIKFQQYQTANVPPPWLKNELDADDNLQRLVEYQKSLKAETDSLRAENLGIFPAFLSIANSLDPLTIEARGYVARLIQEHIDRRISELETMYVQSKLIAAETYLEEREGLRVEFQKKPSPTPAEQLDHDTRLVDLLTRAVQEVDEASVKISSRHLNLEFRQSELLWELSKARLIVGMTNQDKKEIADGEALRLRALKIAEDITLNFPKFAKRSQAMFFTGFAYMEVGRRADGLNMLERFIREFPKDPRSADANRILGDLKFEDNRFAEAQNYYTRILHFSDSPIVGYALYKIGWCAYNQKNYAKALLGLEQAVLWANERDKVLNLLSLRREARHDLIAIYSEIGDYRAALEYFSRFAGAESLSWLTELADELEKNGQYEKSSELYKQLGVVDPTAAENLSYQTSIIRGEYKLHRWDNVLRAAKYLSEHYGTRLATPKEKGTPENQAEQLLREVMLAQQFEFSKSERPADLSRVLALDTIYLSMFEGWPESQIPLSYHAFFLSKHQKNEEAVVAYRNHWTKFGSSLREPSREEALRNLLHALEVVEKKEKGNAGNPSERAAEILNFAEIYEKAYRTSLHAREVSLLKSAILFKYGMDEGGIDESQKLLAANPADEAGKVAFNNLRIAYYKLKDWKKTYEWATGLTSKEDPRYRMFASELKTVREESLFLWADTTEDNLLSAQLFLKISEDPQMLKLREKGLYNAFIRFNKAGKKAEALDAADRLARLFPKFEHLPEIAGIRAALYQEAGDYEDALPLLSVFVRTPHKDVSPGVLQQARLNAGLISEALNHGELAQDFYLDFLKEATKGTPGYDNAVAGLRRGAPKDKRNLASERAAWDALAREKNDYEKLPLPKKGDLATRIKSGGMHLEKTAKKFLDYSASNETPAQFSYEAYCAVPFLYLSYAQSIFGIVATVPKEVKVELKRIAEPIASRAQEIASECLNKSAEAEHDGAMYRRVLSKWGWQSEVKMRERVARLIKVLAAHYPWLDPSPLNLSEHEIIERHLADQGSDDSWYSLAKLRIDRGDIAMARLTLEDAFAKNPESGRLINALAFARHSLDETGPISALFEKAVARGNNLALANLALYHLKGGRIARANAALKAALEAKFFDGDEALKKLVTEQVS